MAIPIKMHKEGWAALRVDSGGIACVGELLVGGLMSSQLVVLAWSAANTEELASEGRILSNFSEQFSDVIHGVGLRFHS